MEPPSPEAREASDAQGGNCAEKTRVVRRDAGDEPRNVTEPAEPQCGLHAYEKEPCGRKPQPALEHGLRCNAHGKGLFERAPQCREVAKKSLVIIAL